MTHIKLKEKFLSWNCVENFLNKTKNNEKNINNEIFKEYFYYQDPSFLTKDLYQIPENENSNKITDIVEKRIDFNKQQRS